MMHSTPALVITPLKTAEAGAGATGWAVGSQPCMGNMPALVPKPTRVTKMMPSSASLEMLRPSVNREPPATKKGEDRLGVRMKMPNRPMVAPATE